MPIQIVIRRHGNSPATVFAPGRVAAFTTGPVRVGSAADCACQLPDGPAFAATLLEAGDDTWRLQPAPGVPWQVNGQPATAGETAIGNGDELAGAGYVLHFHRLRPAVPFARRVNALATFAKLLIVLILLGEIALFAWLPRQIESARLWQGRIARQKAVLLLDDLRKRNSKNLVGTEAELAARSFVGQRLDEVARYLRLYEGRLSEDELRAIFADLQLYHDVLARLERKQLFKAVPPLPVDAALQAVLEPPPAR